MQTMALKEYMDEERTEEQRLEDTRIVADSDDSEGKNEYVDAEDFDMSLRYASAPGTPKSSEKYCSWPIGKTRSRIL